MPVLLWTQTVGGAEQPAEMGGVAESHRIAMSWTGSGQLRRSWRQQPSQDVVEYYVVDRDGTIRGRRRDRGEWSAWRNVPVPRSGHARIVRISAASLGGGHRELYAVLDDGQLPMCGIAGTGMEPGKSGRIGFGQARRRRP